MTKTLLASSLLCFSIFALSPARAVVVTNTTTGTVVFHSDGFEGDVVGPLTTSAPIGSWINFGEEVVTGARAGGPSGAFDGANYLETTRDPGNEGPSGRFSASQSTSGDVVHLEWYMFNTNGDDAFLLHEPVGDGNLGQLRIGGGSVQYLNFAGTSFLSSGATYSTGQWNKWEIDYTIGQNQFAIQINDSSNGIADTFGAGGPIDGFDFAHSGSGTYWVDAARIPEPASLAILLAGGLLLTRRHR